MKKVFMFCVIALCAPAFASAATCSSAPATCPQGENSYYAPSGSAVCSSGGFYCAKQTTPPKATPKPTTPTTKQPAKPTAKPLPSAPKPTTTLSLGSRGSAVIALQTQLISLGYLAADSATGFFGNLTKQAVVQFQIDNNLEPVGYVGPKTKAALATVHTTSTSGNAPTITPPTSPPAQSSDPVSLIASLLAQVKALQDKLAVLRGNESTGTQTNQSTTQTTNTTTNTQTSTTNTTATQSACTLPSSSSETRTSTPCPTGQTGTITETRTASCPSGATAPVWGGWTATASSCIAASPDIVFETQGVMYKTAAPTTGAHTYQVRWTPNNIYINTLGKPLVVKSLDITFHARQGLGVAYADLCTVIMKDGDSGVANDVENMCLTEYKSADANEWDHSTVHIDFPGQGLWFPSNTYFVCGAQGISDATQNPPNYATDITCKATFAHADATYPLPPVQSLRMPYIDQRFVNGYGTLTPHTNTTSIARPVLGAWTYMTTFTNSIVNCFGTKAGTGNWGQQCAAYDATATPNPLHPAMQYPGYAFNPGDQIAGQCTIQAGDNSKGTTCASYFYVAVPVIDGGFAPLTRNATILSADTQAFCNANPSYYALSGGYTPQACMSILAQ